jgi:SAM-dependent methyltransferase
MAEDGDDITTTSHPSGHLRPAPDPDDDVRDLPLSAVFPAEADLSTTAVHYGPGIPDESSFRLLGHPEGRRVLELGCGAGHNAVALAKQGAHVIAVDPSHHRLDRVRALADAEEVRVELHQSDLAELPFVRADTVDAVLSVYALAAVADLDRVFRQVHRVLRPDGPIVLALPHPAYALVEPDDPRRIATSWFAREATPWQTVDASGHDHVRSVSEVFTSLGRANFRVDTILEPEPRAVDRFWTEAMAWVPPTLLMRARKEGL